MSDVVERFRPLFDPEGVVIAGASSHPGKFGFVALHNLLAGGYPGRVFATNREGGEVLGIPCATSVDELPEGAIDLVFVCTPASANPGLLRACAAKGVRAAFVTSAGYGEAGEEGVDWDEYFNAGFELGRAGAEEEQPEEFFEKVPVAKQSFTDQLMGQLRIATDDPATLMIGDYIIGSLDESGYLTCSIEEVAQTFSVPLEEVDRVLELIQSFDPPGVGAKYNRKAMSVPAVIPCVVPMMMPPTTIAAVRTPANTSAEEKRMFPNLAVRKTALRGVARRGGRRARRARGGGRPSTPGGRAS